MKMRLFVLFILAFASNQKEIQDKDGTTSGAFREINAEKQIVVKIEENEFDRKHGTFKKRGSSKFIGVSYHKRDAKWRAQRHSKDENKIICNGVHDTEEEAAHASDTLARKLIQNGEKGHMLNFPDDETEVHKKRTSSEYIGVYYYKRDRKWTAQRRSKNENKMISNGYYDTEEEAAHASDTMARKLVGNGEQGHKLNFPDDTVSTEVHKKRNSSEYIGVSYHKRHAKWRAQRHSKNEKKMIHNGYYETEEEAARASDTLARKFMKNGEQGHKLNFPDDETEVYKKQNKRKRSNDLEILQEN